jgi:hypothetical protein
VVYLILAFSVSRALDWLIRNRLKHWGSKTLTEWDDILVKLADGPVRAITLVFLIHIGLELYDWPSWLEINLSRFSLIVGAVALTFIALRVIDLAVAAWRRQPKQGGDVAFNDQFVLLIGKLLKAVLILITSLTLLGNLGVDITAILGSVSVLGLAFGLAAQDSVANLFGAVAVFVAEQVAITWDLARARPDGAEGLFFDAQAPDGELRVVGADGFGSDEHGAAFCAEAHGVTAGGLGQRFRGPLLPVHRVVGVLAQIGAGRAREFVTRRAHPRAPG